ncbi:MAG: hypothetical protein ACJ72H_07290 [Candidatus Sulfotelmatobacter sp.]|jgi:hypothetical protein
MDNYVENKDKTWPEESYFSRAEMCLKRLLSNQYGFGSQGRGEKEEPNHLPDRKASLDRGHFQPQCTCMVRAYMRGWADHHHELMFQFRNKLIRTLANR